MPLEIQPLQGNLESVLQKESTTPTGLFRSIGETGVPLSVAKNLCHDLIDSM